VTFCDTEDPICIGETTRYRVTVLNQGQEYDTNVEVMVSFPPELQPLNASGATCGTISGQSVSFAPYANIAPRQTLEYWIEARAMQSGDARVKASVRSDTFRNPITQEEATQVN
jgi:hypothetical protein